ncbi:MAG: Tetrahydrofolate dehydrogenase/cyclohydrolase, NAD(P)-binding protein [uncultured bacterium]|uniref:Bifunctional protein FolD n=1 Tax=Candidatus Curtissbacteria bacterium RIFOXYA1_FULL_41_14 TaxID=1797737 RepID=A0A1F5HEC2_9BACT|nr:MAG: Tetrahydrofolate dehydrogenase/cyclohydrolase, NAD(P)-binding protein [uncultured bacterium]KKR58400.1 MAG: hypothetical protein UT95_C0006G0020 [Candidatus Curtissbacteria bacterium GW2011_GWB1_40_28]KKR61036.1 MAG: hypothetical protein UT99_C0003G0021 [Candidatus Curtissbacteria bacterium GW2011_GWA2_40_31]KKR65559.1 MAG: hypothetical protein UU05_C0015G0021 [Candidatus Curtissbacteria bacterium GW2011_GWA1_40_47]OGD78325.1 MAG: hypothetical protein A2683_01985 [Candidatus Curtissbact
MAKILDGKIVRDKIARKLKSEISRLRSKCKLVILQVGDLSESNAYIRQKILFGQKIGCLVEHQKFDEKISQAELISQLSILNSQFDVTGIIVQLPIPIHLDKDAIIDAIDPKKDVDGLTSTNLKLLWENKSEGYLPATTKGILTLCDFYKIPTGAKKVVVVGRSFLVGKPTALAFLNHDATVTVCHKETRNLKAETRNADILVVAVGKPNLITKDHVKPGQVVIDVGINVVNGQHPRGEIKTKPGEHPGGEKGLSKPETEPSNRRIVGDVDFDNVSKIVQAITPVPGGIGPMTVASLFENLLEAYKRQT